MSRLVQLVKTAAHKHPEETIKFLEKVAENDGEIRSGLDSVKGELHRSGNNFRDAGLGDVDGAEKHKDEIMPSFADRSSGGEDGE